MDASKKERRQGGVPDQERWAWMHDTGGGRPEGKGPGAPS